MDSKSKEPPENFSSQKAIPQWKKAAKNLLLSVGIVLFTLFTAMFFPLPAAMLIPIFTSGYLRSFWLPARAWLCYNRADANG